MTIQKMADVLTISYTRSTAEAIRILLDRSAILLKSINLDFFLFLIVFVDNLSSVNHLYIAYWLKYINIDRYTENINMRFIMNEYL